MHGTQAVAPSAEPLPAAHTAHAAPVENLPAAQFAHASAPAGE